MSSSGMLRRLALIRTDVSEELIASINRVKSMSKLGTALTVTSNRRTPRRNTDFADECDTFLRNVCHIPDASILRSFSSFIRDEDTLSIGSQLLMEPFGG
jgi:hypothetical protein